MYSTVTVLYRAEAEGATARRTPRLRTSAYSQGMLRGFDQATNLVLADARERVYSSKAGVETLQLGLYMIRGDNV